METGLLLKHFGTAWPVSFSLEITPPYTAQFVVGGACLAVLLLLQSGVLFITKLNAIFLGTIRITLICCTNNIYYAVCTYTSILVAHRLQHLGIVSRHPFKYCTVYINYVKTKKKKKRFLLYLFPGFSNCHVDIVLDFRF